MSAPGATPAELRLDKPGRGREGWVSLSWPESCSVGAEDYAIYEGEIGSWSSHVPASCSTGGSTAETIAMPAGSRYYLVVPLADSVEGGYGAATATQARARRATRSTAVVPLWLPLPHPAAASR